MLINLCMAYKHQIYHDYTCPMRRMHRFVETLKVRVSFNRKLRFTTEIEAREGDASDRELVVESQEGLKMSCVVHKPLTCHLHIF